MNYAGFWLRTLAWLIDTIIMLPFILFAVYLIYGDAYFAYTEEMRFSYGFWDIFFNYIVPCVYSLFFWLRFGGTPGKLLLGLKIVDAQSGGKISLRQGVLRYLGYFVAMIPLCIGLVWVAFDKRKQGWHDKIGETVVVRRK